MLKSPWSVRISLRVYRMLVAVYPKSFRREYGAEMTELFGDLLRDARRQRGSFGAVGLWFQVLCEIMPTATRQHCHEMQRRVTMFGRLPTPVRLLTSLAISLLAAAVLTPADPVSQLVVAFPLFGVYVCALLVKPLPRPGRLLTNLASLLNAAFVLGLLAGGRLSGPRSVEVADHPAFLILAFLPLVITAVLVMLTFLAARTWGRANGSTRSDRAPTLD